MTERFRARETAWELDGGLTLDMTEGPQTQNEG